MVSVTSHRTAIGHASASFVVIAVIVVGGLAFVSSMNGPSGRSTTGSVSETTFYSGISSQGLQLQIKLNSSEVPQGGALQAHILLVNTLPESVTLQPNFAANPNIDSWNWDDYLCGASPVEHAFGFALFQGHYTAANLSQAGAPLTFAPPVAIPCPNSAYGESYIQNVEFAPNSDMATFSANSSNSAYFKPQTIRMQLNATTGKCTLLPYQYTETNTVGGVATATSGTAYSLSCGSNGVDSLTGYWDPLAGCHSQPGPIANGTDTQGVGTIYENCFHQFTAGPYTIVAEDLWNQTAFAYFEVGEQFQTNSYCSTPVHLSNASGITEVYVFAPGSTGVICVSYQFRTSGTYSFSSPDFGPLNGSSFQACGPFGSYNGTVLASCRYLSITALPASVDHSGPQNVTVAYTIQVGANAKGLFWFFIGSCDPIALAIGEAPTSVPGPVLLGCVVSSEVPNSEAVTGVSNVSVVEVSER